MFAYACGYQTNSQKPCRFSSALTLTLNSFEEPSRNPKDPIGS